MKIPTSITWEETYIPPRCRKPRITEKKGIVNLTVKEVPFSALKLAFCDNSFDTIFNADNQGRFIYSYNGKLWERAAMRSICADDGPVEGRYTTPLEALVWWNEHGSSFYCTRYGYKNKSYRAVVGKAIAAMQKYLIVDGVLYVRASEPRYCIYTFGLGHNHGGTALSTVYGYNPNIPKTRYFTALEGEKAVDEANRIAANRGDTDDVGRFKANIIVYDPSLVKCNPSVQHGHGNKLINALEELIDASSSATEAGLLTMAYASASA